MALAHRLLLVLPLLVACGGAGAPPPGASNERPDLAPERVEIGGRVYVLEVFLNRDFMPISPPGGRPMLAVIRVKSTDGTAVPGDLRVDRVWLFQKSESYEATSVEQHPGGLGGDRPGELEAVVRDGPKWEPGTAADVVTRLTTAGARHLLAARDQTINASH